MDNSNSTSSMSMAMTPWLHFGNTDFLIFKTWRPSSHGAIAGACVGLVLFCILDRSLAAYRRIQELHWRAKTNPTPSGAQSGKEDSVEALRERTTLARRRLVPPFTPSHDIPRGVIQAIQSAFSYALMLAVMTFNGAYIVSIILGLGIGEILVGRMGHKQRFEWQSYLA